MKHGLGFTEPFVFLERLVGDSDLGPHCGYMSQSLCLGSLVI